jgi:hypothetical protein
MALDDPLGNHAAVQYDVINHGKDGIGAVSSRYVCNHYDYECLQYSTQ